jgi:hypothetical protein
MVEIHHVYIQLVWVDAMGNVILKNDSSTTIDDIKKAVEQQHRIVANVSGPTSTINSQNWPKLRDYLAAEASDNFAVAYMDQYQLITQMIT